MANLKPWYRVVPPQEDLREGKPLDASEFAVHLELVGWCRRVVRASAHAGRVVGDVLNFVIRQHANAQLTQVQPFIRRPFQAAVIEIEPVDVDTHPRHGPEPLHPFLRHFRVSLEPRARSQTLTGLAPKGHTEVEFIPPVPSVSGSETGRKAGLSASGAICPLSLRRARELTLYVRQNRPSRPPPAGKFCRTPSPAAPAQELRCKAWGRGRASRFSHSSRAFHLQSENRD